MTAQHLQQWIEHPELLNRDTLYELRTLVARYPYFQSLRLLYLKNLYLLHDINFGAELRKAVLYVADRRVLFYLIEGDRHVLAPKQKPRVDLSALEEEPGMDRTLFLIDSFLATVPEEFVQSDELDYTMDYTAYLMQQQEAAAGQDAETEESPRLRGQSLIDSFLSKEAAGQSEPVAEMSEIQKENPTESVAVTAPSEAPNPAGEELFATSDVPDAEELPADENEELSDENEVEEGYFTETLAKIYIKQQRYDKALEIIKKISLNFPKKNAYFADQIRFLEKLIINAKSK